MAVFDHKVQYPPAGYLTGSEVFLSAQIIWFKYCRGADVIGLTIGARPYPEDGTDAQRRNWLRDDDRLGNALLTFMSSELKDSMYEELTHESTTREMWEWIERRFAMFKTEDAQELEMNCISVSRNARTWKNWILSLQLHFVDTELQMEN